MRGFRIHAASIATLLRDVAMAPALAKGKPKKVALVAVMRKLLVTLNVMIKNQECWREPSLAIDKN
jgi:hypothetical protein